MRISKIAILVAVLLMSVGSAIYFGAGKDRFAIGNAPNPAVPPDGSHADVQESPIVHGIGYVEPVSDVRNLSFKSGGVIRECRVEVGKQAHAGDLLMVLDDATEQSALAVAEQEVELAKADSDDVLAGVNKFEIKAAEEALEAAKHHLAYAEHEYQRRNGLVQSKAISKSEFDSCETTFNQAQAEMRRAEAQLRHLQNFVTPEHKLATGKKVALASAQRNQAAQAVADTRLLAPTHGTVLEILRREGESVSSIIHEPVIVFGDTSRLRVRAEIDERYVRNLKPGQRATIFGRTLNNQKYAGTVVLVKNLMGKRTVFTRSSTERKDLDVVQVFIDMGSDFALPAGLRVDVAVETNDVVPTAKPIRGAN